MLNCLEIKNIALISSLNVEFEEGLNILSGETGTGKSIIIDSLNFVLGKRADKSLIRYGENTAIVKAFFDISNNKNVQDALASIDIDCKDELLLQRSMTIEGKNQCSINGQKVTLSMLKDITSMLVDIYGQHESTSMLDNDNHISIIDNFGQNELSKLKDIQQQLFENYRKIKTQLNQYGSLSQVAKDIDTIEFQIKEIENADIHIGEEEELLEIRRKFNNSRNIIESLGNSYDAIAGDDEGNVFERLSIALKSLNNITDYDKEYSSIYDRLDSLKIELDDIVSSLGEEIDNCQFDSVEYQRIEERIELIHLLKKKYGNSENDILQYFQELKDKYEFLINGESIVAKLESEKIVAINNIINNTSKITKTRKAICNKLSKLVIEELNQLGMKNCQFVCQFEDVDTTNVDNIDQNGGDRIVFLFSANKGQPPKDLSKIISGGELSRFMLAIKNIIANIDNISTMVFDEIDTGISGNIAQVVAEKLYKISTNKQVLAVTHLPQLASMADCHYLIHKYEEKNTTISNLKKLSYDESIQEIARLIGGSTTSEFAIPHAKEMKNYANQLKSM